MAIIDIKQKIKETNRKPYFPVDVIKVNDQILRIALFDGKFHWHKHDNEDELFFIYNGEIEIQYKDRENVVLKKGQIHVVPKGVEHSPKSIKSSYVLMFEPFEVNSKGD